MERIAHYHILDRIGAGGMGEVYRARDTRLGRTVAIKVLPEVVARDAERRDRFLREARASAALSHPNICALFEVGDHDDQLYLVFEYVPGETLRRTIDGRPLNLRTALDTAIQLADALADAHAAGIIHRDIKPENIIITPKGHPKILDFGLASFTESGMQRESAATELKTAEGVALGTAAYMSPEQALGVGCDHRTDIFSLGIVVYEMLTGRSPFKAPTGTAAALQIVQATPPPPSAVNRNVPGELDGIVQRALSKDPNQRYQAAATMAAELRSVAAILDVREAVELEAPVEQRRARWQSILAIVACAAIVMGALWMARAPIARLGARWFGPPLAPIIAVMPFELIAGDPSRLYFADGLTEDMITRLGQVPGVKVLGRSATREYRGRPPKDVASELHAAVVLTGSVQSAGDRVKVTVGLVDPADGTQIWSNTYEEPLHDVFAVQTEIAEDVARRLSVTLVPSQARARTAARQVNAVAYDLYLRGRDAAARRDVDRAVELYRQSIQADPALAEAHAGLAEALHLRIVSQGLFRRELVEEMRRAALDAAASDPDLPQAQLALGLSKASLDESLKHLRRAIELDPSYAEAYHHVGDQIMEIDPERALAFYARSLELDPRMTINHSDIATTYMILGKFAEAAVAVDKALREPAMGLLAILARYEKGGDALINAFDARIAINPGWRNASPMTLYVSALQQTGQPARALTEAEGLAARVPDLCEARAMLAAVRDVTGPRGAGSPLAAPIILAAEALDATPPEVRCGVMAGAAVGDADAAGRLLTRVASNPAYLRYWVLTIMGLNGQMWIRGSWFPFNRVADRAPYQRGVETLRRAFDAERGKAAAILAGLVDTAR